MRVKEGEREGGEGGRRGEGVRVKGEKGDGGREEGGRGGGQMSSAKI